MPRPRMNANELTGAQLQRRAFTAHERMARSLDSEEDPGEGLREVVRASWQRSVAALYGPTELPAQLVLAQTELEEYRQGHPLASIMPVIERLLIVPGREAGLLVAVGDEHGRLLWVEGNRQLLASAAEIGFAVGADWSEKSFGTSAPGTALVTGNSVQISGAEHFNRLVHPWSCTAVPFHDPESGSLLGVIDITGDGRAVENHTLSLVAATVAAGQAQLSLQRLRERGTPDGRTAWRLGQRSPRPTASLYRDSLQILGRDQSLLNVSGRSVMLSERHSEILALLALHPAGLSAEQLAIMVYPEDVSISTVRAEMLRLRRVLQRQPGAPVPQSRPYRLPQPLTVDVQQVRNYLNRGAHRLALGIYRGAVLPRSQAPAIIELRHELGSQLRSAILGDASAEVVLEYLRLPEAADDVEAWRTALRLVPARSPKRAGIISHLERLEAEMR